MPGTAQPPPPSAHPSSKTRCASRSAPHRVTKPLDPIVSGIVADPVDVPVRPAPQVLHPVRAHRTGTLRQRLAVLALQTRAQPQHILPEPPARLRPPKPNPYPPTQLVQLSRPRHHHHSTDHPPRSSCAVAVLRRCLRRV